MSVNLIYCFSGNKDLADIALSCGFNLGLRLPFHASFSYFNGYRIQFSDQNWKKPDFDGYLRWVSFFKPSICTVIDIEHRVQLKDALNWADSISLFTENIVFIPKVTGIIKKIPRDIGGAKVRLGYSVPSSYGKTELKSKYFDGWDVHLLGGSPERQIEYGKELKVVSLDCNYHSMKANKFGEYWTGKINDTRFWRRYDKSVGRQRSLDAFRESCIRIKEYWNEYKSN